MGDLLLGRPVLRGALATARGGRGYDEFAEASPRSAAALRVGDPLGETTQVGSLISREHATRVRGLVDGGLAEGGELLAGGDLDGELGTGWTRRRS